MPRLLQDLCSDRELLRRLKNKRPGKLVRVALDIPTAAKLRRIVVYSHRTIGAIITAAVNDYSAHPDDYLELPPHPADKLISVRFREDVAWSLANEAFLSSRRRQAMIGGIVRRFLSRYSEKTLIDGFRTFTDVIAPVVERQRHAEEDVSKDHQTGGSGISSDGWPSNG